MILSEVEGPLVPRDPLPANYTHEHLQKTVLKPIYSDSNTTGNTIGRNPVCFCK